jgi:phage terminase Nu1 subunit (DNA packaging protein)
MALATIEQIATVLNLTPRMINRHVKENGMPRVGRGDYDLVKCVHWYIDFLHDQIDRAKRGGETEQEARGRLTIAQANMKEIELARLRAEVITVEDCVKEVENAMMAVRSQFLTQAKSMSLEVSTLTTVKEIEEYINERTLESLSATSTLSDRIRSIAENQTVDLGEDPVAGAAAEAARVPVGGPVPVPVGGSVGTGGKVEKPAVPKRNHGRNKRSGH